jgi:tetratricopeptide (TPR) repeat protein
MGYFKKSFKSFKEALMLYESISDMNGMGYTLCGLGGVSRMMGNFELSFDFYTRANLIMKDIKDKFGIAYSYCGLANASRMFLDYDRAGKYFKLAARNYEKIGDRINYAYTLWGEGTLAKIKNDFDQALEKFSKAEEIFSQTGDKRGLIYTELGKIEVNFILNGKLQNKEIKRLLQISEKMGYNFERLHIMLVEKLIKNEKLEDIFSAYLKLGSKFFKMVDVKLPLNLP